MEQTKINSKMKYEQNRVIKGFHPHKLLEMEQQKIFAKMREAETKTNHSIPANNEIISGQVIDIQR